MKKNGESADHHYKEEMKLFALRIAEDMKLDLGEFGIDVLLDTEMDCDALVKDSDSVKIFINPKSLIHKNKSGIIDSIEHEMGHLYLIRKHPKVWRLFQKLQKPNLLIERILSFNNTLKDLSIPLVSAFIVFLAILSAVNGLNLIFSLIFFAFGVYFYLPYFVEESLASYFGSRHRVPWKDSKEGVGGRTYLI